MAVREKKNPRNTSVMLDLIHIVVGILVVVCVVLAFLFPEKNRFLFPLVFWLAAFLNGVNGWNRLVQSGHDRKKKAGGAAFCLVAVILLTVGVLSAVSMWRTA
ncbi:MAG: hypothetical protein LUE65_03730 [Clostridiales bacterium]|nr:hypothetical protein [Clostridiales bacterium]MCD8368721.1 hypothetical protein [Clostridiales bacterium]